MTDRPYDAITFLMEAENISFPEAVMRLAALLGLDHENKETEH